MIHITRNSAVAYYGGTVGSVVRFVKRALVCLWVALVERNTFLELY